MACTSGPELTLLRLTVPGRAQERRNHQGPSLHGSCHLAWLPVCSEQSVSDVRYAQATDAQPAPGTCSNSTRQRWRRHQPLTSGAATPSFLPAKGVRGVRESPPSQGSCGNTRRQHERGAGCTLVGEACCSLVGHSPSGSCEQTWVSTSSWKQVESGRLHMGNSSTWRGGITYLWGRQV